MKINFPITITAADTNKRTISGTIVSWNEAGRTLTINSVKDSNYVFRGIYDNGADYNVNDVVIYNGIYYIRIIVYIIS